MPKILLVEDDETISLSITFLLKQEGYQVTACSTIDDAKRIILEEEFSLILLDLSLPDGDGYDLGHYVKEKYNLPVIIITARDSEKDIVKGFDLGSDDYITKPFKAGELLSRTKNIIKRYKGVDDDIIIVDNIKLDANNYIVYKDDNMVELTPLEYKILLTLFQNKGLVLTRDQILSNIWDSNDIYVNDNTLTVYIKRIREKIEKDSDNPKIIKTIRGIGYKVGN